jgi:CRISPR-associated protein Csm4
MQTYRATFHLASPSLTPWQADTLFGHLCWALAYREGASAVQDLLARCQAGAPPLVLSDGFPADRFPRPLLPPQPLPQVGTLSEQIAMARRGKAARDSNWLTGEQFARVLQGQPLEQSDDSSEPSLGDKPFSTLHNQINRATGTTTGPDEESGNLFAVEGEAALTRVVYVYVAEEVGFDWQALFAEMAQTGFGKRKSVGYGSIRDWSLETFEGFGEPEDANGFVSVSAFIPAANDPTDGQWRTDVKYGKLGEAYAIGPNPFKRPLVRLLAGAVFRTPGRPRPFYGRLVGNVAPGISEVAQYGFALAVPIRLAAEM